MPELLLVLWTATLLYCHHGKKCAPLDGETDLRLKHPFKLADLTKIQEFLNISHCDMR